MRQPRSSLREAFTAAITAVVAGSGPLVLLACGDDGVEPGIETTPGFVPIDCRSGSQRWLAGLTPAVNTEYMELRGVGELPPLMVETEGELCAGAREPATCSATFAALHSETGFPFGACQDHICQAELAATQGDEALLVASQSTLTSFLAPIDVPAEAMLLVHSSYYSVNCERGGARPSSGGFDVQAFRTIGCDGRRRYLLHVDRAGTVQLVKTIVEVKEDPNCAVGRRPIGLCAAEFSASGRTAGGYFARAARLEAASVHAFHRLRRELRLHCAPRPLLDAARRAAQDEVRHARVVSKLARAFGAKTPPAQIEPLPLRDLESVARENATEGCVRETFGALVAAWQARHAGSPSVRSAYARIAEDELRHAVLAWKVAAWAERRLSRRARASLSAARREAISALTAELDQETDAELVEQAGVPHAIQARALAEHLKRSIWRESLT